MFARRSLIPRHRNLIPYSYTVTSLHGRARLRNTAHRRISESNFAGWLARVFDARVSPAYARRSTTEDGANLSLEAGNAIEVITSLITTLHAIRDREFVFHERYPHLALRHLRLSASTYVYYILAHTRACVRAYARVRIIRVAKCTIREFTRFALPQRWCTHRVSVRAMHLVTSLWRCRPLCLCACVYIAHA